MIVCSSISTCLDGMVNLKGGRDEWLIVGHEISSGHGGQTPDLDGDEE